MKSAQVFFLLLLAAIFATVNACQSQKKGSDLNIIFLHHSTGLAIWNGKSPTLLENILGKMNENLADKLGKKARLSYLFQRYNAEHNTNYSIKELTFPKAEPYGWNNYPYDYYNIWVKNAGDIPYLEEPTLETLSQDFQVIILKHCFPVSNILPDTTREANQPETKTIPNYKSHYMALRDKMQEFPETKFIVFTGAAQVKSNISEDEAQRYKEFYLWVIDEWDVLKDNIYIWDLYRLQTEGGLYFADKYATSPNNSHPNEEFSRKAANLLFQRIIDIINNEGNNTLLTGEESKKL